jgi:hypothetical protein
MATTLQDLRREVGKQLGDLLILTATDDGTDTVFYDNLRLTAPDNAYKGRNLYFTDGTALNIGSSRRVQTSVQSGGVLNLTPALPANVMTGDEAELWGIHAQGWLPGEVNDMLKVVNRNAMQNFFIPVEATVTDAFDPMTGYITLPAAITVGIFDLEYLRPAGDWSSIDRATNRGGPGYWTARGLGKIIIGGDYWLSAMNGMDVRVIGYGDGAAFEDDDDETLVNPEYMVWETVYRLLFANTERSPERSKSILPLAMQEAKIARERSRMRPQPDWQRV